MYLLSRFPDIQTLDDVIPHIGNTTSIISYKREYKDTFYTVVNYVYADRDVFFSSDPHKSAVARECRGLIFNSNGVLISRPFHKFFNYGENDHVSKSQVEHLLNIRQGYSCAEKLDGSMIHAFLIDGELGLATRAGITDISNQAKEHLVKDKLLMDWCIQMCSFGYTPIFEWCSRANRVVIDHPQDKLVLTAVRHRTTGDYLDISGIPEEIVKIQYHSVLEDIDVKYKSVVNGAGYEGIVVKFFNGHMLKMKTDDYCLLHRTTTSLWDEKELFTVCIEDKLDDIVFRLPLDMRDAARAYNNDIIKAIETNIIVPFKDAFFLYKKNYATKKEFALSGRANVIPLLKSIVFSTWDYVEKQKNSNEQNVLDFIRENVYAAIKVQCNTRKGLSQFKSLFRINVEWTYANKKETDE